MNAARLPVEGVTQGSNVRLAVVATVGRYSVCATNPEYRLGVRLLFKGLPFFRGNVQRTTLGLAFILTSDVERLGGSLYIVVNPPRQG